MSRFPGAAGLLVAGAGLLAAAVGLLPAPPAPAATGVIVAMNAPTLLPLATSPEMRRWSPEIPPLRYFLQ